MGSSASPMGEYVLLLLQYCLYRVCLTCTTKTLFQLLLFKCLWYPNSRLDFQNILCIHKYILCYAYVNSTRFDIYIYIYIITSYAFLFRNITKFRLNDETFKIWLYFDFHKSFAHTGIIYVSCVYIYV